MENIFYKPLWIPDCTLEANFPKISLRSSINVYFEEALWRGLPTPISCVYFSHVLL